MCSTCSREYTLAPLTSTSRSTGASWARMSDARLQSTAATSGDRTTSLRSLRAAAGPRHHANVH